MAVNIYMDGGGSIFYHAGANQNKECIDVTINTQISYMDSVHNNLYVQTDYNNLEDHPR